MLFGVVHSADVTGFVLFVDFSGGARRINIFNCDGFQGQEVLEHVEAFYTRCWVGKQCIHQYILCVFFISSDCTRVQISILNMLSRYTTNTLYLSLFWDSLWQYIYDMCNKWFGIFVICRPCQIRKPTRKPTSLQRLLLFLVVDEFLGAWDITIICIILYHYHHWISLKMSR